MRIQYEAQFAKFKFLTPSHTGSEVEKTSSIATLPRRTFALIFPLSF